MTQFLISFDRSDTSKTYLPEKKDEVELDIHNNSVNSQVLYFQWPFKNRTVYLK